MWLNGDGVRLFLAVFMLVLFLIGVGFGVALSAPI